MRGTVARKPTARSAATPSMVETLINKGGTPAKSKRASANGKDAGEHPVLVRLTEGMKERVDSALESLSIKTTQHRYIIEAIDARLRSEGF